MLIDAKIYAKTVSEQQYDKQLREQKRENLDFSTKNAVRKLLPMPGCSIILIEDDR